MKNNPPQNKTCISKYGHFEFFRLNDEVLLYELRKLSFFLNKAKLHKIQLDELKKKKKKHCQASFSYLTFL